MPEANHNGSDDFREGFEDFAYELAQRKLFRSQELKNLHVYREFSDAFKNLLKTEQLNTIGAFFDFFKNNLSSPVFQASIWGNLSKFDRHFIFEVFYKLNSNLANKYFKFLIDEPKRE